MGSIPSGVVALLRGTHPLSPVSPNLCDIFVGRLCFASPCKNNNRLVCMLFQQNIITPPAVTAYWNNAVGNIGCPSSCSFCDDSIETVVHLFWHCIFTKTFFVVPLKLYMQKKKKLLSSLDILDHVTSQRHWLAVGEHVALSSEVCIIRVPY